MKKIYRSLLLLVLALAACQKGDIISEALAVSDEMSFDVLTPGLQTKVAGNSFEASDIIGLFVTDYVDDNTPAPLQVSGNRANNFSLTYDGATWTPEKVIYWGKGKSDVYAYYPYINDIQDVDSQYFEVLADQTGDGYEASDLLWAKAEGVKQTDGAVSLQMKHVMSKLTVKIVAGEDYVGSLPDDASVLLHSTVTGARVDFTDGSVSKDPYSGARTINMKKVGIRNFEGVDAVVYEAIVVPQMLESSVPLLEINSKSVSYLLEDPFNFRPGVAYTYTATLNTSTTAIKVEIGCELEDWNGTGGDAGEGGESGEGGPGEGDDDAIDYVDLSSAGTANCYLIQGAGDYKFRSVIGNTDATVGNVKSVEVLWESFGTDEMPNVGDLVASVSYKNGYIRFSTSENFRNGNAVIAAKNSKGAILWSWHIWCAEEGWREQVYFNDAGTMMDRNLGASSATPGEVGTIGLMYQWGRKDPFMGPSSLNSANNLALSTGVWSTASGGSAAMAESNPMIFYSNDFAADSAWLSEKTVYDPCPSGWRVPDGGEEGVWAKAYMAGAPLIFGNGLDFSGIMGTDEVIYYPLSGWRTNGSGVLYEVGVMGCYWSSTSHTYGAYLLDFSKYAYVRTAYTDSRTCAFPVRCQKE